MTDMVDLRLAGAEADIRALIETLAAMAFPGAEIAWSETSYELVIVDTVRLDLLVCPAREASPETTDPGTGMVIPAVTALPAGACVRVVAHGGPHDGDHITAISTLVDTALPIGMTMNGVTRLPLSTELASGFA